MTWRLDRASSGSRSGQLVNSRAAWGCPLRPPRRPWMRVSIASLAAICAALFLYLGPAASAAAGPAAGAHGQLLQIRANTNESSNWFGYNLGSLERGGILF